MKTSTALMLVMGSIVALGIIGAISNNKNHIEAKLDAEIAPILVEVLTTMDARRYANHLQPAVRADGKQKAEILIASYRAKFGTLKTLGKGTMSDYEIGDWTFGNRLAIPSGGGPYKERVHFTYKANFEKRTGVIEVSLRRDSSGPWLITSMSIF